MQKSAKLVSKLQQRDLESDLVSSASTNKRPAINGGKSL